MEPLHLDNKKTRKPAYVTLLSVMVLGAVGAAVVTSLLLLGLGSSRSSLALEQSLLAKGMANACAEEALQEIRDSTPFTGNGNLVIGTGTCTYSVISLGGQSREIEASGSMGSITRKVKVTINAINPSLNITSWEEVADF